LSGATEEEARAALLRAIYRDDDAEQVGDAVNKHKNDGIIAVQGFAVASWTISTCLHSVVLQHT